MVFAPLRLQSFGTSRCKMSDFICILLKTMASKGIEQRHLFRLYQSVILGTIDYGLGLTIQSQAQTPEAGQSTAKRGNEDYPWNNKGHTNRGNEIHAWHPFSVRPAQSSPSQSIPQNSRESTTCSFKGTKKRSFTKGKILDGTSRRFHQTGLRAVRTEETQGIDRNPMRSPASL